MWIDDSKLPLGVNKCVNVCLPCDGLASLSGCMFSRLTPSVHKISSGFINPDQDKVILKLNEQMNKKEKCTFIL